MTKRKQTDKAKTRRMERGRKLRRKSIIDIAEQAFIEFGYDNTMIDQVALDAGYTKATIYNYFESKDDLFTAVLSRTYELLHQTLSDILLKVDAKYELRTMGDAYLVFVDRHPGHSALFDSGRISIIISSISQKAESIEELTESEEEFRQNLSKVQELMTDVITQTMRNSGVEGKVDPFSVIMALSSLNSAIRELVVRGKAAGESGEKTREYLSVLFNIIDQGLKHYDSN